MLDHYQQALSGLARAAPGAEVVLRPHPSQDLRPVRHVMDQAPDLKVSIDPRTPIDALMAATDLCVGSLSTATLQAATCGAAVVVLNVTDFDWRFPLGGDTPVPVARNASELATLVGTWRGGTRVARAYRAGARTRRSQARCNRANRRAGRGNPHMTSPPATGRLAPVTYEPSSPSRNMIVAATSSGLASR